MKPLRSSLWMSFCILIFSQSITAQFGTGEISGMVTDPSGAAIARASVKIRNEANGQSKAIFTDDQGRYAGLDLLEGRLFQDIPLNGRNPTSMMLLKAGVSSTAAANAFRPTSDARSYYILGSRAENENLTLDGVSMLNGRNNLKGVELVSVDAMAEANILTSTYPAEFPRAGGGLPSRAAFRSGRCVQC